MLDAQDWLSNKGTKLRRLVSQLVLAKADVIQLRDKGLPDSELIEAGKLVAQLVSQSTSIFIMNDRAELAAEVGADGVHLGQEDGSVAKARKILGAEKLIGVSTHSIDQALQAVSDQADYVGVGPVFPSRTKSFSQHVGLELVESVSAEINIPAFAIGGIDLENVEAVVAAGLRRIAVSAAVVKADDPAEIVKQLKLKIG